MKPNLTRVQYTIPSFLLTTIAILSIMVLQSPLAGALSGLAYLIFHSRYLGSFFLPQEDRPWRLFFGFWGVVGLLAIILTSVYWVYEVNPTILSVSLAVVALIIGLLPRHSPISDFEFPTEYTTGISLLSLFILASQGLLFYTLLSRQTGDTLISPWTLVGSNFFVLFALTTLLLFLFLQQSQKKHLSLLLLVTHSALTLTVVLTTFAHGFGFDQFIHQATESWIIEHGFITPKQPYYIGQYMIAIATALIAQLDVQIVDRLLVPVFAIIALMPMAYFAFSRSDQNKHLFPSLLLLFFIPFSFFTFTTPNNLALVFALITFFWIWHESQHATVRTRIFGILMTLTAITIHPFIGVPALLIYLGSLIKKNILLAIGYWLSLTLALPLLFLLNSFIQSGNLTVANPFSNLTPFLRIFEPPHWFIFDTAPFIWQLLYSYRLALPWLIVGVITVGLMLIVSAKGSKFYIQNSKFFYPGTIISLLLSTFLLATAAPIAGVISYEQNVFARRLLELALLFSLPLFLVAAQWIMTKAMKSPARLLLTLAIPLLLLTSFYFTYPTRDPVSLHTGYAVRDADIEAVHFIDERNGGEKNYIVLTNQTVAVAALREFGFEHYLDAPDGEHFFYSIPTGGPLYQFFRSMVYEQPIKKHMTDAMDYVNVDRAYFVHTNYWAPAGEIRDAAKLEADNWWELAEGRVWVYEYVSDEIGLP